MVGCWQLVGAHFSVLEILKFVDIYTETPRSISLEDSLSSLYRVVKMLLFAPAWRTSVTLRHVFSNPG